MHISRQEFILKAPSSFRVKQIIKILSSNYIGITLGDIQQHLNKNPPTLSSTMETIFPYEFWNYEQIQLHIEIKHHNNVSILIEWNL